MAKKHVRTKLQHGPPLIKTHSPSAIPSFTERMGASNEMIPESWSIPPEGLANSENAPVGKPSVSFCANLLEMAKSGIHRGRFMKVGNEFSKNHGH